MLLYEYFRIVAGFIMKKVELISKCSILDI
jgi:hypothetical protein